MRRLFTVGAAMLVLTIGVIAQTQFGTVTGTVKDPNGAVVAGACWS